MALAWSSFDRSAARIQALGPKQAEALENIEEHVGNFEDLPARPKYNIQAYLLAKHLYFDSRFELLTFLCMNRVAPVVVAEFLALPGMLSDQHAVDHILSLLKDFKSGKLAKYKAYVMETKTWESISSPKSMGPGKCDWEAAKDVMLVVRQRFAHTRRREY